MSKRRDFTPTASLVLMLIDVVALVALAVWASQFKGLFSALGKPVPVLTSAVLSVRYLNVLAGLALVLKERLPHKMITLVINGIVLVLLAFIVLPVFCIAMFAPVFEVP